MKNTRVFCLLSGGVPRSFRLRKIHVLLGLAPLVLLSAGFALWRVWPAPHIDDSTLTFNIAGHRLRFAANYVRTTDSADPDRVDLVVLAPDFAPAAATPLHLPATGEDEGRGRAQIFLTLTPAPLFDGRAATATPAERYGPHVAPEVQVTEGGLLRRRFEDKSPYAGEDLYLAPPDGEQFFARCQRQKVPSDGLPSTCLSEFRVEGLLVEMRFDPAWLGEWRQLRTDALLLTRSALAP